MPLDYLSSKAPLGDFGCSPYNLPTIPLDFLPDRAACTI